jgi:hypothetical protein
MFKHKKVGAENFLPLLFYTLINDSVHLCEISVLLCGTATSSFVIEHS